MQYFATNQSKMQVAMLNIQMSKSLGYLIRPSSAQSHQEYRGLPETCVNSSPWLWPSKIHAFLQGTEILLIRRNRAADVHRNAQVSLWLLYGLCESDKVRFSFIQSCLQASPTCTFHFVSVNFICCYWKHGSMWKQEFKEFMYLKTHKVPRKI